MARPLPTDDEILEIRSDLVDGNFLADGDDLQTAAGKALNKVKIDLEDKRGVLWSQVWDANNSKYFVGADGVTRNDDKIPRMISLKTVRDVFRDYAIQMGADSQWWVVSEEYEKDYQDMLLTAKLDEDLDDSGSISDDETGRTGQVFLRR
jgi:hypothetical protein